jgi:nucleoside-diphosphate-sugar epimerase
VPLARGFGPGTFPGRRAGPHTTHERTIAAPPFGDDPVMSPDGPALFLTGATGFVGGGLLKRLLATRPDRRVILLVRHPDQVAALASHPQVSAVLGDLTRAHLGLDRAARQRLERSVTEVLHCAAVTQFGLPLETARAVNTEGTRQVLELARRCRTLARLAYVSTVYVAGRTSGAIAEAPARRSADGFCNTYQQSKHEAEALVLDAMADVPAAIYRLSSIVGDSRTGRVQQWNHVHQLMRLFPQNILPIIPADPAAPVDLIATDWAIPALAHLFDERFVAGDIAQICAGREASLTVRELIDLTGRAYEHHPLGTHGPPIRVPDLVPLSEFEAYVERHRHTKDRLFGELLRILSYFLPHLGIYQAFDNRMTLKSLHDSGLEIPPIREYYERIVAYGLNTAWGKRQRALDPASE